MKLGEYRKLRLAFRQKAIDRDQERMNNGMGADEDVPHYAKVTDEILIHVVEKLQEIEALLKPAPAEKGNKVGSRLKLG